MTRRMLALLVAVVSAVVSAFALAGDALGPFVNSGAPLSASAMRSALDARSDVLAQVREQVIEVRRAQVALRDRVAFLEHYVATSAVAGAETVPLEADDDDDPWTEAGIVAGQVADAEALNDVFTRFVSDLTNIRAFQALLILDQEALLARIEALEAIAGIVDPPAPGALVPNEDEVTVPHIFTTGSAMRASEMNANLVAVDAGLVAEAAMAGMVEARQAVLAARVDALEEALGPEPLFTWRIGTYDLAMGARTESHFIFQSPAAFESFTITVTGPEGYERSTTVTVPTTFSTGWTDALLPSGTYTATTTYGGVDFTLPITYDATRVLPRPDLTLDTATTSTVGVTIGRVEGAVWYDVRLTQVGVGSIRFERLDQFAETTTAFQFTSLDLDPSATYYVFARSFAVLEPWSLTMTPQQVDSGASTTPEFQPVAP